MDCHYSLEHAPTELLDFSLLLLFCKRPQWKTEGHQQRTVTMVTGRLLPKQLSLICSVKSMQGKS